MVKTRKPCLKREADRRIKQMDRRQPFQPTPRVIQPRSLKDRQQMWVLSGLRHLKAPVVVCLNSHSFFLMVGLKSSGFGGRTGKFRKLKWLFSFLQSLGPCHFGLHDLQHSKPDLGRTH